MRDQGLRLFTAALCGTLRPPSVGDKDITLRVYTGLPASGKSSAIISEANQRKALGDLVELILSNEHKELTRRHNVRVGGFMGCRDSSLGMLIDHVVNTAAALSILAKAAPSTVLVFDEAQYFDAEIVRGWCEASKRGVDILVGTPSGAQLTLLGEQEFEHVHLSVPCACGKAASTQVVYDRNLVNTTHFCGQCYEEKMNLEIQQLLDVVKAAEPFPGELHTYQPFYDIDMSGWKLVRNDCPSRISIILEAVSRCESLQDKLAHSVNQPSFVDVGCCSGFFSDGMAAHGFTAAGVDVSADFIEWATRVAYSKAQNIRYTQENALTYLEKLEESFDVISTFATIQWVMAQQGYEAGLKCFDAIFKKTDEICVVEMGYTEEDIYKDKILDRPVEIDRNWVLNLMESSNLFDTIEVHPAGEAGIWRDIFVGFKHKPSSPQVFNDLEVAGVAQTSSARGYFNDGWVGRNLEVGLVATQDLSSVTLEGWRPDDAEPSALTVTLSGDTVNQQEVGGGVFHLEMAVAIKASERLHLKVSSSRVFTPEDDARQLGFILRQLAFS